jgi:hypothetical protein
MSQQQYLLPPAAGSHEMQMVSDQLASVAPGFVSQRLQPFGEHLAHRIDPPLVAGPGVDAHHPF